MLLRDTSNWTNLEETKGLLFLVQRLEELTFPYSLDSYKSPTMSVQGLLLESLTLIRESQTLGEQNFEKAMNSLSHIIDEIRLRLKGNFIAKSVSSLNLDTLTAHKGEKEPITEVERRFKIAYAELNSQSYLHEIISNIIELGNDGKNKAKLDFLAREFSSFLQSRGVSREHMQNVLQDFFWKDNEIKSTTQFKQFCIQVYPHQHRFCVVFGVASTLAAIDAKTLRRANATILPADLDEEIDEDISEGFYDALMSFKESVDIPTYAWHLPKRQITTRQ